MELTGRKKLIVQAATTRVRNASKDDARSVAEFEQLLSKVEKELGSIFEADEVALIMDDISDTIEAEAAMNAMDASAINAVLASPEVMGRVLEQQQEAADKGVAEPETSDGLLG